MVGGGACHLQQAFALLLPLHLLGEVPRVGKHLEERVVDDLFLHPLAELSDLDGRAVPCTFGDVATEDLLDLSTRLGPLLLVFAFEGVLSVIDEDNGLDAALATVEDVAVGIVCTDLEVFAVLTVFAEEKPAEGIEVA